LDDAAMERADDGPAASEVFVSKEAVALPLQKRNNLGASDGNGSFPDVP
jgi:hypothetical protein